MISLLKSFVIGIHVKLLRENNDDRPLVLFDIPKSGRLGEVKL